MKTIHADLLLAITKKQSIHLKWDLTTKYNLLTGDTALGKTLAFTMTTKYSNKSRTLFDMNGNKWCVAQSIPEIIASSDADIIFIDEALSGDIDDSLFDSDDEYHDKLRKAFKDSESKFIFVSRGMECLPIDYKSIFTLDRKSPISRMIRLFPDYLDFDSTKDIIVEDSKTEFEYYSHWYKNVTTANGKGNLAKYNEYGNQIVADGAAIGYDVKSLDKASLYLSESFEYDLAKAWRPKDFDNLLKLQPNNSESVEVYVAEEALPALCRAYYLPVYTKSKPLHKTLLKINIHENDKLEWCRRNAPKALSNCSDSELLEFMESAWNHRGG